MCLLRSRTLYSAENIVLVNRSQFTCKNYMLKLRFEMQMTNLFLCSMSPPGEEHAALRQCVQARAQLEEAIAGVIKAEAQLRGNSREVRGFKHVVNPLLFQLKGLWFC